MCFLHGKRPGEASLWNFFTNTNLAVQRMKKSSKDPSESVFAWKKPGEASLWNYFTNTFACCKRHLDWSLEPTISSNFQHSRKKDGNPPVCSPNVPNHLDVAQEVRVGPADTHHEANGILHLAFRSSALLQHCFF